MPPPHRWPPSRTALPALFPSVRCVDLAWLERHPLGQAALAALMAQLAGLTKLGRLVLGQVGRMCVDMQLQLTHAGLHAAAGLLCLTCLLPAAWAAAG